MIKKSCIKKARLPLGRERLYDVLQAPLITEKSTFISEKNWVSFKVGRDVNKFAIKQAVETLFNVKVEQVNTLIAKGKVKRFRGHLGKRQDQKKAIVKLKEGYSIDMASGVIQ